MALARYYLALRLSAAVAAPLPASTLLPASPAPVVRSYESRKRGAFDERELLDVDYRSLVLIRPLNPGERDPVELN